MTLHISITMAQTIPFPPELLALDNRDSPIKLTNFSEIAGKVGFTLPLTYIMVEQAQALNTVVKAVPGVNEATRQAIGAFALKVNSTFGEHVAMTGGNAPLTLVASPVQPGNQQIQQILDEIRVLSAEVRAMRGETRSSELRVRLSGFIVDASLRLQAANSVRASIRAPLTPLPAVNGRHLPVRSG